MVYKLLYLTVCETVDNGSGLQILNSLNWKNMSCNELINCSSKFQGEQLIRHLDGVVWWDTNQ